MHFAMADHAALVQWLVVCIALAGSLWVGWLIRGPRRVGKIAVALGLAVLWGVGAAFVAAHSNEFCRSYLHLCPERGDGNMAYWLYPLFATPFYLVSMLAFGYKDEAPVVGPSLHDTAVDAALVQLQGQNKIHQRCPSCHAVLVAEHVGAANTAMTRRVHLRCACGKCDQVFDLRIQHVDRS